MNSDLELLSVGIAFFILVMLAMVSLVMKVSRYHQTGSSADTRTVEDFGTPARTLYTAAKLFSVHHRIDITDEEGNIVYQAKTKLFSLHDRTWVTDGQGNPAACIWAKLFSLHERHYVEMKDGTCFELSNELFHVIRDVTRIEGLGWVLEGNVMQMNFVLRDSAGDIIAAIGRKAVSVHQRVSVDIYQPQQEGVIAAIVIALEHIIQDRRTASVTAVSAGATASSVHNASSSKSC